MKTLVIHLEDNTTDFLKTIYIDRNFTVVNHMISSSALSNLIKDHDRIIMLGHGTPYGLLSYNGHIINSKYVYLLRDKLCVCIWCHANIFVEKYGLKGFYTGMFISEVEEADYYNINTDQSKIDESNELFAKAVSLYLDDIDILPKVLNMYKNDECNVTNYNREKLRYR